MINCTEFKDILEELQNNIHALNALSGLFCGQYDSNTVNLNELSYLIGPIVDNEKDILARLYELCKKEAR